jgi:hypothetical protein
MPASSPPIIEPAAPSHAAEVHTETSRARIGFALCALVLCGLHVLLVDHFMPFADVFSDKPLQGIDYDLHIGQVYRVVEALSRWHKTWLYDVQLLAGQPEGTIMDSGSKGWELWTYALYAMGVPRAIAFNSFVLAIMLSAPGWLYLAGWAWRLNRWGSLSAAAMASTLWFFDSHLHWVWFVGMISWTGASCFALFTMGLFYRFIERPTPLAAAAVAPCLGTGLLIHPYTFFILAPPLLAMYVRAWSGLSRAAHAYVLTIAAFAIAENAFWLHNAAQHWHYILDSAYYAQAHLSYLAWDFLDVLRNGADSGVIGTRTGFRFLYLALAIAGLLSWRRERDSRVLPIATALAALYAAAYLGEFIPGMQQTQPYRQITPAMLLTCLPAAAFVTSPGLASVLGGAPGLLRALLLALGFALTQQLVATQVLYFLPEFVPRPKQHPDGARSPLSGYGHISHRDLPDHLRYAVPHDGKLLEAGYEQCIRWFEANAKPGERVLVQAPLLGERLAWRTKLEVLGGFFERNMKHVDANYFREHQTYVGTPDQFAIYLGTYAVRWVVGDRPEFRRAHELLQPIDVPGCRVYRTMLPADRVLSGGGTIRASENRLDVRGSDPQRALVVSYHWHEALRCKPECRVERAQLPSDRVGLIRVPAPHPADVVIWNSYEF